LKNLILKSHANELFEAIKKENLNPNDFEWTESNSSQTKDLFVSALIHKPSGYYYIFDYQNNSHWCSFSPGSDKVIDNSYPGDWTHQYNNFINWLKYLIRETTSPDLWKNMILENNNISYANIPNDIKFSINEHEQIKMFTQKFLTDFNKLIGQNNLNNEIIVSKLKYLEESSQRQGKQDWVYTAIGVFFTIITAYGTQEHAKLIFNMLYSFISQLVNEFPNLSK